MRLPGTESWLKQDVDAQVAFETGFANDNQYLVRVFAQGMGQVSSIDRAVLYDTEAIFARGRAAELAFVTEDILSGVSICVGLLQKIIRKRRCKPLIMRR
jgi:hypothetical protein